MFKVFFSVLIIHDYRFAKCIEFLVLICAVKLNIMIGMNVFMYTPKVLVQRILRFFLRTQNAVGNYI